MISDFDKACPLAAKEAVGSAIEELQVDVGVLQSGITSFVPGDNIPLITDNSGGIADIATSAVTTPAVDADSNGTADSTTWLMAVVGDTSEGDVSAAIMNNFATIAEAQNKTANDIATISAKLNALLSALITAGIIEEAE